MKSDGDRLSPPFPASDIGLLIITDYGPVQGGPSTVPKQDSATQVEEPSQ